jgi:hypothetical protein
MLLQGDCTIYTLIWNWHPVEYGGICWLDSFLADAVWIKKGGKATYSQRTQGYLKDSGLLIISLHLRLGLPYSLSRHLMHFLASSYQVCFLSK